MKKIRYLTDAGMVTAILIIFLLLSRLMGGILEETCTFLLPIPIALYTIKYDFKKGLIPMFAASLLAFLIIDPLRAVCFIIPSNIIGLIYGSIVQKHGNIYIKLSVVLLGSLIINALTTVIFSKVLFGYTIIEDTKSLVTEMVKILGFLHLNQNFVDVLEALMIGLIPSILIAVSFLEGLLVHAFTVILANRIYKLKMENIFSGFRLAVPRVVSYVSIPIMLAACFGLPFYVQTTGFLKVMLIISINFTFILAVIYLIQGIMYVSLYVAKSGRRWLIFASFLSIFLFPLGLIVVGILDSLFDLKMRLIFKK